MKRLLFSCLGILAFAGLRAECSVIEIPLQQRANASTLIVEGKVASQYSYWNSNHTMIYTANIIELYKVFKGNVNTTSIEIITEGGTVGLDRITVEPTLELSVGETGMFTCTPVQRVKNNLISRNGLPQFEAYASIQGFVKYNETNNTASDHFRVYNDIQSEVYNVCGPIGRNQYREVRSRPVQNTQRAGGPQQVLAGPDPQSFSPTTLRAGTGDVLEIFGEGFGAAQGTGAVRFPNADDGGATMITPLASQYLVWQDDYIKLEVPQNAGTGTVEVRDDLGNIAAAPGTLTISFAHLNVDFDPGPGTIAYETDHVDDNGSGGYTWRMNTAFDANASARASFMRAFDTWRCATLVNWSIGATTSINDAVSDGTNIICFDNTAPLSPGVLGVCYSYWSGCASGPTIIWYVNELDIIFDEGSNISPLTWEFGPALPSGSEYDFETVAVHELGHGHQLGHVIAPGAIMHYAISNGSSNRSLGADDLAGGQFVQAKSVIANVCGPGAMSNGAACGSPPVAAFSGTPTTVCAGSTVSFTDQSTNTPTSWQWTFTGGSPSNSTVQNPTVTYNTPGVYDVTLVATNASGSDGETMVGYITVVANPSVGFSANPGTTVCEGSMVTLSGTGAASYGWTGGVQDGVAFAAPSSNTSYTVTGTDGNGCTGTAVASLTINSAPNVSITANPGSATVCAGDQVTLSGNGAQSYGWSGGITDGVAFTPVSTTTYTVTGTGANGCTATAQQLVTVNSIPNVGFTSNPANGIVCSGQQATLNGTGAQSYIWTGGVTNGVPFTPPATTTYTVTGTSAAGCTNTAQATITVNPCSGPTTTVPCGLVVNNKGASASAVNVPGATQYRFTFYDNVTLQQVTQLTQTSRTITFTSVPLYYNTTYRWTVAVNTGSGFGPESSIGCTITFGVPATTVGCGVTFNGFNGYTTCPQRLGVTNYIFRFYDNVTLALVTSRTQVSNYIYFNQVSGLSYGTTYRWTVQCEYPIPGGGTAMGPESNMNCTISFGGLATTVPCNKTYNLYFNPYTTAQAVGGASGYRFTFYQGPTMVAQRAQSSNYIYFNQVTPTLTAGSYTWTVEVLYNSGSGPVYGTPSAPCPITFVGAVQMPQLNTQYQRTDNPDSDKPFAFAMLMYPNPLGNGQSPTIQITGADQKDAVVHVMDLTGRVITTYTLYCEGNEFTTQLTNFPELTGGMYIMQVTVGDQVQSQRFVAE